MTQPVEKVTHTFAEYLALERAGTPEHGRLAMSVGRLLGNQLVGRPCGVFSSDVLIRVLATGLGTYPDLSVVCGRLEHDPGDDKVLVNPIVLIEVLSDGTERYDRGEKFAHYRRIPSLQEYVLVSQHEPRIEVFRRNDDGKSWTLLVAEQSESATLTSIGCRLDVDEVYANPLDGLI